MTDSSTTQVIKVCTGCSCSKFFGEDNLKRAEKVLGIREGETTPDGRFRLERSGCLGQCHEAPNVMFCTDSPLSLAFQDGELHTKMLPNKFEKKLREMKD